MPRRNIVFANNEYYHVFNRGVARMPIYLNRRCYQRFLRAVRYYKDYQDGNSFSHFKKIPGIKTKSNNTVEIITYVLIPNHFHFLLRQKEDSGIHNFMRKLTNSYSKFFNTKNNRQGPLFQGGFKAVLIETTEQLIHVSRYIHLNPVVSNLVAKPEDYEWSSYREFIGINIKGICNKEVILEQFSKKQTYQQFVNDHINYAKTLERIKHLALDPEV